MRYVCSLILGISLSLNQLSASTFFKMEDKKILTKAEHVIKGTVDVIETRIEGNNIPYQYIQIIVDKVFKTKENEELQEYDTVTIRQIGGETEEAVMIIDGMPKFVNGTEVLISINKNKNNDFYYVVGAERGKYDVHGKELVRDTSESMFIRKGPKGIIQFYPGKVETSSLSEITAKIPVKRN